MSDIIQRHIIITSPLKTITKAYEKCKELGLDVSEIKEGSTNTHRTFYVYPASSKEGWEEDNKNQEAIGEFYDWAGDLYFEDDSHPLVVIQVDYREDGRLSMHKIF